MSLNDSPKNSPRKTIRLMGSAIDNNQATKSSPPEISREEPKREMVFDSTSIILALLMGKVVVIGTGRYKFFNKNTQGGQQGNLLYTGLYMRMSESENWKYTDISFGKFVSFIEQNITGCSITA